VLESALVDYAIVVPAQHPDSAKPTNEEDGMPQPPPGITNRDFRAILRRLEEVVGREWVFSSDEDTALYRDAYSPLWGEENEHVASAAVAPSSVEEVQQIVAIANEHRLPIYPISNGKNLTYGGSAPVYSGSVVLDLKRMNRILDVNERDKTCLVEPGVSYFDLYRHIRQNKLKLWIDTADPGWGSLVGNALDHGVGYTGHDFRDHFDAHCGMEVVLANGDVVRTGMGAAPKATTWQLFKYGMGPWVDGIFSQSNFGIVTKMGFWLMEEPQTALEVMVTVPRRDDVIAFLDILTSLMWAHVIPSTVWVTSPVLLSPPTPEFMRLRTRVVETTEAEWAAFAQGRPFWASPFSFWGPKSMVAAAWEHTKDRLSAIPGVTFAETGSYAFPLTDEQVEAVANKPRLAIPSLDIFGSRQAPGGRPSEGHLDFSPIIAPRGEELLAIADVSGKVFQELGVPPSFLGGLSFHPRAMMAFMGIPTYRTAEENQKSRAVFERLMTTCAEHGWTPYRTHAHFQSLAMQQYSFNDGALQRLHHTLKDALDPNGILSAGRYGIVPKHLRGRQA
jgi:4-cresol dehydrogenase (hydroxylating)